MSRRSTPDLHSASQASVGGGDGDELLVAGIPDNEDAPPDDETGTRSALQVLEEVRFFTGRIRRICIVGRPIARIYDSVSTYLVQ